MNERLLDALVRPSYRLGGRSWPFYALFVWTGIVAGVLFALALARTSGVSAGAMAAGVGAGLLAAGALALGTELLTGREVYTFYHYQIVVLLAAAGGLALLGRPVLPCLDLLGPTLGLVQGFGRIGCFMAGCCHGRPHRWGVCYRQEHAEQGFERALVGVRLFPIQAVESLSLFALASAGAALVLSERPAGSALATYLVGYGALRFGLEFARGDAARRSALGFSEAQWTAGFVLTATVALEAAGLLPLIPWHPAALIVETHVLNDYEIEVLRDGLPVPLTAAGQEALHTARTLPPKRRRMVQVQPGEVHRVDQPVSIDEWFDVSLPATYLARVRERTVRERPALSSGSAGFEVV